MFLVFFPYVLVAGKCQYPKLLKNITSCIEKALSDDMKSLTHPDSVLCFMHDCCGVILKIALLCFSVKHSPYES